MGSDLLELLENVTLVDTV